VGQTAVTAADPTHLFVAPDLEGPLSGGTLYNARLVAALRALGVACAHTELARFEHALAGLRIDWVWLDSLYLDALPQVRARCAPRPLCLIAHYLPSLSARGRMLAPHETSGVERRALSAADAVLVTSAFMRAQLARLGVGTRRIILVEPGVELPARTARSTETGAVPNVLMLCAVTRVKGVLPFLRALAPLVAAGDRFCLRIAGRLDAEPDYARACAELIAREPGLRGRVQLLGVLPPNDALGRLQESDLLLSASTMEAYGMALAEARAAGVPIVARAAGHVPALVTQAAGGSLADDEHALCAAMLALTRDPPLLAEHKARAARAIPSPRSYTDAARELLSQLEEVRG